MPASVIAPVAALRLNLALTAVIVDPHELAQSPRLQVRAFLLLLVPIGIALRARLAWQGARILSGLEAIGCVVAAVIGTIGAGPKQLGGWDPLALAAVFATKAACLTLAIFALGRTSAKLYFDLQCPYCGNFTSKSADLFFRSAKCRPCGAVW
jgi:hypothetical protein